MTVDYVRAEPPADPAKLEEFEVRLGQPLPADFRSYLARQDGGRLDNNGDALNTVFGVGDVPDWASLWGALAMRGDRVPEWLLPVADDEYGNLYCLSLRETDAGTVWFWDHEGEVDDEPPTEDNLTRKASSWTGFLAAVEPVT